MQRQQSRSTCYRIEEEEVNEERQPGAIALLALLEDGRAETTVPGLLAKRVRMTWTTVGLTRPGGGVWLAGAPLVDAAEFGSQDRDTWLYIIRIHLYK